MFDPLGWLEEVGEAVIDLELSFESDLESGEDAKEEI